MLNDSDDSPARDRMTIGHLLEQLARESRQWASAELVLARIELAELKVQAVKAATFAVAGMMALLCVLLALTQAGIALVSAHVSGVGVAALVVAAIFALIATGCALAARRMVTWRGESLLLRWLATPPAGSEPP